MQLNPDIYSVDKQLFLDLYNDKNFSKQMKIYLAGIYEKYITYFDDNDIDFEDLVQEMWVELFDDETFNPDTPASFHAIKCNAKNYVESLINKSKYFMTEEYDDEYTEADPHHIYKNGLNFNSPFEHYENSAQPHDAGVKHARL